MKIGIIGGTGGMGEGFALRWCTNHEIIIGSRDKAKAQEAAERYHGIAKEVYKKIKGNITGEDNSTLAKNSDILLLSIPYETINDTCSKIADDVRESCIVVSPIVPMTRVPEKGWIYLPFENGTKTAAELVAANFRPGTKVVSAFHTISEVKLRDIKYDIDGDTYVCSNDLDSVKIINQLIYELSLRPIYLGQLSLTYQAEVMTPMILNAARRNRLKQPGLKLTN
ncbi:MAG: NADPH-dependent F420 reductase [Nitrososphaeraceae archaeon]|nr:NADPH-dependent F420 reductase [Nitrososphaeraceae archaeon]